MKVLAVIPTYNEKENIKKMIAMIKKTVKDIDILVVDDNSPDGTANAVKREAKKHKGIKLMQRPEKKGLGTAYVEGFKYAIEKKYDLIFEMDADFSHDPAYMPEFIKKMKKYDLVIGSRYINGVSVVNWPIRRLMLSKFASRYVRMITGMPFTDCTSGFKCFKRKVLEAVDLDRIDSDGYSFQVEMHYKAWKNGFEIGEHPIIFVDRHAGTSKMSREVILEAVIMPWKLRFRIRK
ncbi:MAG TPA: polyprenol monophosphomannose synthase [Firmicutes bacterium]|nr:polyprenol monophosphomannose synthase [Bacillota bacterium]